MSSARRRLVAGTAVALAVALGLPTLASGSLDVALSVTLQVPSSLTVGDDATVRAEVANDGTSPAAGTTITLSLPGGHVVFSSVAPPPPACSASPAVLTSQVTCSLGELPPGDSVEVRLVVSVIRTGPLQVGAEAASSGGSANGQATIEVSGASCDWWGTQGPDERTAAAGQVLCGLGGNDRLQGGPGNDVLYGGTGADVLEGSGGNDLLDGGIGPDTVSYTSSPSGIRADIAAGTSLGWGTDQLRRVEHLVGSEHDDVLHGDGLRNRLEGRGGSDILRGRAGRDVLRGGPGADFLHGGLGADTLNGGTGDDICVAWGKGTRARCQPKHPRDPKDTSGLLDVARVRTALGSRTPRWTIRTHRRWSTRAVWDRGYVVVWLDTLGPPAPDHYALLRSNGGGVVGGLFRVRSGRDEKLGSLTARRPDQRSISVRIPLTRLNVGPHRAFYRWGVQTLFTGQGCGRVCFDPVPGVDRMYLQPLP